MVANRVAEALAEPEPATRQMTGYTVYLNGELSKTGWLYYYPLAFVYKVPEGTWILVVLSLAALVLVRRTRRSGLKKYCSGRLLPSFCFR